VNYNSDSVGTQLNYKSLNNAVSEVRSGKELKKEWKADIEADYQQRIIELITFIKKELDIEHYYHSIPNYCDPRSLYKIYNIEDGIGWRFLPMMNLTLLLHKTRSIPAGEEWQNHIKPNDLAFSIVIASDEDNDGELSPIDSKSEIHIYIYQCQKLLTNLQNIEPRFAESLNMLASIEAELGEISANMRDVAGRSDIDPNELAAQEQRMGELMGMARKYRIEPEALPQKLAEIDERLQSLQAAADLEALTQTVARNLAEYQEAAHVLSAMRHQAAGRLGEETTGHMQHLAMKGARFDIVLLPSSPTAHGLEQVQFQVAANKGNPSRPLNKVASGGELARISLALQVVPSQYTQVPTLIFDEVDTGIGGGVAEMGGKALRALGKKHQVLAVTHLPQVASCGENHWQVRKHSEGEQTVSEISVLDHHQRIEEIARMLGGEIITDTTRSHAAELLHLATA